MNYSNHAIQQYSQVSAQAAAGEDATPHRLIQMLMDGALDKIALAKGYMENDKIAEKGSHVSWAILIIAGLRASLDVSAGGAVAENFEALYDYMKRRWVEANLKNNPAILNEITFLLKQIRQAWMAIPAELRNATASVPPANQNARVR